MSRKTIPPSIKLADAISTNPTIPCAATAATFETTVVTIVLNGNFMKLA